MDYDRRARIMARKPFEAPNFAESSSSGSRGARRRLDNAYAWEVATYCTKKGIKHHPALCGPHFQGSGKPPSMQIVIHGPEDSKPQRSMDIYSNKELGQMDTEIHLLDPKKKNTFFAATQALISSIHVR
jgi:hypothetical protein